MTDGERLARAALARITEPDDRIVANALYEPLEQWRRLCAGEDLPGPDGKPVYPAAVRNRVPQASPEQDLAAIQQLGGRFVCPGDDDWPASLDELGGGRPLGLYVRGSVGLAATAPSSVAIVGSRAATDYGSYVAGRLAADLADTGRVIVSGGAYGIDSAAHRGTLAAGGATIAVLACGVDVAYPRSNGPMFDRARVSGALISEWPPGALPMRHRFLTRNRVIAALTAGTVVVEAAVRSGALRTARDAHQLGRPVMFVPGPVTSAMSVGCHQQLRELVGARVVTCAADVLEEVGRLGDDLAPLPRAAPTMRDAVRPTARRLLDHLPRTKGRTLRTLSGITGRAEVDLADDLAVLELAGLAEQHEGGWRLSDSERSRIAAAERSAAGQDPLPA